MASKRKVGGEAQPPPLEQGATAVSAQRPAFEKRKAAFQARQLGCPYLFVCFLLCDSYCLALAGVQKMVVKK